MRTGEREPTTAGGTSSSRPARPMPVSSVPLLQLQGQIGNRAVTDLLAQRQAERVQRNPQSTTAPPQPTAATSLTPEERQKLQAKLEETKLKVAQRRKDLARLEQQRSMPIKGKQQKQRLKKLDGEIKTAKGNLQQVEQNGKDLEDRLFVEAPQAKSWFDLGSWGGLFGSFRSGWGSKGDTTGISDLPFAEKVVGEGGGQMAKDKDPTARQYSNEETWVRSKNEETGKMELRRPEKTVETEAESTARQRKELIDAALDIPLIEINISPDEKEEPALWGLVNSKRATQHTMTLSGKGLKGASKIEASFGRGGKLSGEMGRAYVAGDYVNSQTALEGFVGAKGGAEGEMALTWEEIAVKGQASAFAGLEAATKTEVVLKIAGKEAGRFKGGIGITVGVGGQIGGSLKWPWGGDLEIRCDMKAALGLGFSYEIDWKIPTATWAQWGWSWLSSWFV